MKKVLVIVPIHSRTETLNQALRSVQNQTFTNFEVQILADGANLKTMEIAQEITKNDKRFHLQAFPKSPRRGETQRHIAILESSASHITYLADDDLFLPHHIEYMMQEIGTLDFANPSPTFINRKDEIWCMPTDISQATSRNWHLSEEKRNSIGLTGVLHSKQAYLRLPEHWTVTPKDFP